jgi:hypothetical protein
VSASDAGKNVFQTGDRGGSEGENLRRTAKRAERAKGDGKREMEMK